MRMATREKRLEEFTTDGIPPVNQPMEVLCEDGTGTYLLPFECKWENGYWHNGNTGHQIEAVVVGWRAWNERSSHPI